MATLNQLTVDGDGTIGSTVRHDAGTGTPFFTHLNDAPDGVSSDYVENDDSESSADSWWTLTDVNADFGSMDTLNIDIDVEATEFDNDTCTLTAQIFDADNGGNQLTANVQVASDADAPRLQRNLIFSSLTGSKAQWGTAHLRLNWVYSKTAGPDNANIRVYGVDIDGTYTAAAGGIVPQAAHHMKQMAGA